MVALKGWPKENFFPIPKAKSTFVSLSIAKGLLHLSFASVGMVNEISVYSPSSFPDVFVTVSLQSSSLYGV